MSDFLDIEALDALARGAPEPEVELKAKDEIEAEERARKPAEVVTLTPEEFAALKAKSDDTQALIRGIADLGTKLGTPAAAPVNAPQQTPEEYFAEHADDLFDKEKGAQVLAQYNKMVSERDFGPMLSNLSSQLASTKRELLAARDPLFKKYEKEVEALVKAQPQSVQVQPDIFERAWLTVRENHREEIQKETVAEQVEKAVAEKLKELGIDPGKPAGSGGSRPPAYQNSESRSVPGSPEKRVIALDSAVLEKLKAEADRRGVDVNDLARSKGLVK